MHISIKKNHIATKAPDKCHLGIRVSKSSHKELKTKKRWDEFASMLPMAVQTFVEGFKGRF